MNVTKEGVEVQVGQVWRDLDKRMHNRRRHVIALNDEGKAQMGNSMSDSRPTWVSIRRMHRHATGWALVAPAPKHPNGEVPRE